MENLKLTQLEEKALNELVKHLDVDSACESQFSGANVEDLSKHTNIEMSKMRGVVSSLIQKDIVYIEDFDCDGSEMLYINDKLLKLFF